MTFIKFFLWTIGVLSYIVWMLPAGLLTNLQGSENNAAAITDGLRLIAALLGLGLGSIVHGLQRLNDKNDERR